MHYLQAYVSMYHPKGGRVQYVMYLPILLHTEELSLLGIQMVITIRNVPSFWHHQAKTTTEFFITHFLRKK